MSKRLLTSVAALAALAALCFFYSGDSGLQTSNNRFLMPKGQGKETNIFNQEDAPPPPQDPAPEGGQNPDNSILPRNRTFGWRPLKGNHSEGGMQGPNGPRPGRNDSNGGKGPHGPS